MAKQTHLLARIHRNIGGVMGWLVLFMGLGMLAAGIFTLLCGTGTLCVTIPQFFGTYHPPLLMTGSTASLLGIFVITLVVTIPIVRYCQEKAAETEAKKIIAEFDRNIASGRYKNAVPPSPHPIRSLFGAKTYPPLVPANMRSNTAHNTSHIWSSDEEVTDTEAQQTVIMKPVASSTVNAAN